MATLTVLQRMNRRDLTVHGFRSTFRDWAAERTDYPSEMAEISLAHTVGSAVENAYRRSDLFERRRRLIKDWAGWCIESSAIAGTASQSNQCQGGMRRLGLSAKPDTKPTR
jgi:hypothetical protein